MATRHSVLLGAPLLVPDSEPGEDDTEDKARRNNDEVADDFCYIKQSGYEEADKREIYSWYMYEFANGYAAKHGWVRPHFG